MKETSSFLVGIKRQICRGYEQPCIFLVFISGVIFFFWGRNKGMERRGLVNAAVGVNQMGFFRLLVRIVVWAIAGLNY
ncbi:hypothetical protein V8C34DRAFT_290943 [Trichoderma compactum]